MRRISKTDLVLKILVYCTVIPLGLFMIIPFAWVVTTSLKSWGETLIYPPVWIPSSIHLENLVIAWNQFPFAVFYLNSAFIAIVQVLSTLGMSTLAGYAFAKHKFFGRNMFFITILATMTVPFQVYMIPNFMLTVALGWHSTYQGALLPYLLTGFSVFIMRQFMREIPDDYIDAARVDGCSEFSIYRKIVLPLTKPAIATIAMLTFVSSWNNFLWPMIVLTKMTMFTVPLGVVMFYAAHGSGYQFQPEWNLVMAATLVAMLPMIIVFVALQKYFIRGVVMTGLKG